QREDRGIRADAERQRQRRHRGEPGRLREQPRAVLQVLQEFGHNWHLDEWVGRVVSAPLYNCPVAAPTKKPDSAKKPAEPEKKKKFTAGAWEEARALIWKHRSRLALGLVLMLVNRLAGLVAPLST